MLAKNRADSSIQYHHDKIPLIYFHFRANKKFCSILSGPPNAELTSGRRQSAEPQPDDGRKCKASVMRHGPTSFPTMNCYHGKDSNKKVLALKLIKYSKCWTCYKSELQLLALRMMARNKCVLSRNRLLYALFIICPLTSADKYFLFVLHIDLHK